MMTGTRGRLKSAQNSPCTSCNAAVKKQDEGVQCDDVEVFRRSILRTKQEHMGPLL